MKTWLSLAVFSVLWLDLIRQLSYIWETNQQYAYGWFVPILALGLFLKKWPTRPRPDTRNQNSEVSSALRLPVSALQRFSISALVFLLCLLYLPLRVIHEINQDWPLITWPLTLCVVLLTLYAVHLADPFPRFRVSAFSFSPWVKHFAFPICFILVAVSWPYRIEHALTQNLMQVVASSTVEIMGWFGIPAIQRGNLIELSTGVLGVDEACSGIRSFQSTLMASLFLGELYALRWPIRLLLVGAGLTAAFLLNICRTLLLTWQANAHGLAAIDKWHDPAGFTIAIASFFVLWGIAVLIKRKTESRDRESRDFKTENRKQKAEIDSKFQPSAFQLSPLPSPDSKFQLSAFQLFRFQLCRRYLLAVGCWAVFCLLATETWYRAHARGSVDTAEWWVSYPTNAPGFKPVTVSPAAAKLLRHDVESGGTWEESDGSHWSVFCFRWNAGDPTARMSARGHRPEYCMVGSGHQLDADLGIRHLPAHGLELPFRTYIFDKPDRTLYVFFCLWEDGTAKQAGFSKSKYLDRLTPVLAGRRGAGQQTLELILSGYPNVAAAEQAVRDQLPDLIKTEKRGSELSKGGNG